MKQSINLYNIEDFSQTLNESFLVKQLKNIQAIIVHMKITMDRNNWAMKQSM